MAMIVGSAVDHHASAFAVDVADAVAVAVAVTVTMAVTVTVAGGWLPRQLGRVNGDRTGGITGMVLVL